MSSIYAFVDGSPFAESVCDHAAWASERLDLPVAPAHALDRPAMAVAVGRGAGPDGGAESFGRAVLEQAERQLRAAGVETAEPVMREGGFVDALCALAEGAAVAVIGKRGMTAEKPRPDLGANLERTARARRGPLLVAARGFRPIRRALIAFDGGPSAIKAVDWLIETPLLRGLALTLFTVGPLGLEGAQARERAAAGLADADHAVWVENAEGEPTEAIERRLHAGDSDILVMGAYGHSRMRALFLGSTTTEMLRAAETPVLLFR
ncbi:MAG: universal stress protein [Rhodobacteraceae bacterium]|nr:MAG: universal stress protein [Paracoccaceae bacterium]